MVDSAAQCRQTRAWAVQYFARDTQGNTVTALLAYGYSVATARPLQADHPEWT
jgi:hypothetical protein